MNTTFALLTLLIQTIFCHQSHSTTYQKKRKKLTIGYLNFCTDFVGTKVINFTLIWKCRLPENGTFIGPRKGYLQRILSVPALTSNIETLYQMLFFDCRQDYPTNDSSNLTSKFECLCFIEYKKPEKKKT